MDEMLLRYLVSGLITVFSALITTFLVPSLKNWISNLKNDKLLSFIQNSVKAAEQIYGSGTGSTKKDYVIDLVKTKFKKLGLNDSELDTLIESAVYEVSGAIKTVKTVLDEKIEPKNEITNTTTQIISKEEKTLKTSIDNSSISSI